MSSMRFMLCFASPCSSGCCDAYASLAHALQTPHVQPKAPGYPPSKYDRTPCTASSDSSAPNMLSVMCSSMPIWD